MNSDFSRPHVRLRRYSLWPLHVKPNDISFQDTERLLTIEIFQMFLLWIASVRTDVDFIFWFEIYNCRVQNRVEKDPYLCSMLYLRSLRKPRNMVLCSASPVGSFGNWILPSSTYYRDHTISRAMKPTLQKLYLLHTSALSILFVDDEMFWKRLTCIRSHNVRNLQSQSFIMPAAHLRRL